MGQTNYLTLQDVLWINLQILKRTERFDAMRLEEATFYQYGYGKSEDLLLQAGRLLAGFSRQAPFDSGNDATAFVATLAFLAMNGVHTTLNDDHGRSWLREAMGDAEVARGAISGVVAPTGVTHSTLPKLEEVVDNVLQTFPCTVSSLSEAQNETSGNN